MSKADCLQFLVIGVLLMVSLVVDAQPTLDEDGSCEFPALDETARDVKLIREDLRRLFESRHAFDSSSLCEYNTHSLFT